MLFFRVLGRVLGRFFKAIGRGFGGFFRWIARHEMFLGLITVVVVLFLAVFLVLNLLNINIVIGQPQAVQPQVIAAVPTVAPTTAPTAAPTTAAVTRTNAPAATEAFMIGQINGDADEVWNTLTATLHNQLTGIGRDKTYFERLFEAQKQSGLVFESYQYIGGVPNDNGTSIHFYVLTVKNSQTNAISKVPWTFEVDKEGKIAQTDFPTVSGN